MAGDVDDEQVRITRTGNRIVAFLKNSFVEIRAEWFDNQRWVRGPFINFEVCMPHSLCSHDVSGHLGNCDRITNNDVSPDNQCELFCFVRRCMIMVNLNYFCCI